MNPDNLIFEEQTPMQMARDTYPVHKVEDKYLRKMPSEEIMQTHFDPSMLFSMEDCTRNPCEHCKKPTEECVCDALDDELLDTLIQQVSVPNLAALYQKAQDQGLVKPMYHYQSNS